MVKLDDFSIEIESPEPLFSPGDSIVGKLTIRTAEIVKIHELLLELKGEAFVHWSYSSNGKSRTRSEREVFINQTIVVLNKSSSGQKELTIGPGEFVYPFNFILPKTLPTSFEHVNGRISYYVHATLDIPWSFNKHAIRGFTVLNKLDLNQMSGVAQACGLSDTHVFCCGPCQSSPVNINFSVQKTGFVPGEEIAFQVSIDNVTKRKVKLVEVMLIQKISLRAHSNSRYCPRKLTEVIYGNEDLAQQLENFCWSNGVIKIPPVCPSLLESCKILQVSYSLDLHVLFSEIGLDKWMSIPVVIGTYPIIKEPSSIERSLTVTFLKSYFDKMGRINPQDGNTHDKNSDKAFLDQFEPLYPFYPNLLKELK